MKEKGVDCREGERGGEDCNRSVSERREECEWGGEKKRDN